MNRRLILILPLILAAALFTVSPSVPSAHALTGLVCITDSTSATSCPASPPSLGPFTVGQTFSIGIFVQGSDAMGGFDIYIATDAGFVNPTSAALGTLIASPTSTIICINGLSVSGACTVGTANGPGVVEVSTLESLGSNECGGLSPCSGIPSWRWRPRPQQASRVSPRSDFYSARARRRIGRAHTVHVPSARAGQSLRQDEVHGGRDTARPSSRRAVVAHRPAALLQPGRCSPERRIWHTSRATAGMCGG